MLTSRNELIVHLAEAFDALGGRVTSEQHEATEQRLYYLAEFIAVEPGPLNSRRPEFSDNWDPSTKNASATLEYLSLKALHIHPDEGRTFPARKRALNEAIKG